LIEVIFLKRRAEEPEKGLRQSLRLGVIRIKKTTDDRGFNSATGVKLRIWIGNGSKVIGAAFIPGVE